MSSPELRQCILAVRGTEQTLERAHSTWLEAARAFRLTNDEVDARADASVAFKAALESLYKQFDAEEVLAAVEEDEAAAESIEDAAADAADAQVDQAAMDVPWQP